MIRRLSCFLGGHKWTTQYAGGFGTPTVRVCVCIGCPAAERWRGRVFTVMSGGHVAGMIGRGEWFPEPMPDLNEHYTRVYNDPSYPQFIGRQR